jgi:hypothetical protein
MTRPSFTTRVAFASTPLAASPSWDDISADAREIHITRGRSHELDQIASGVAIVVLDDTNGDYTPDNAGGAYYPNVTLNKRVNIRATYGGSTYDRYTGYSDELPPSWLQAPNKGPVTSLKCTDLFECLQLFPLTGESYSAELSGTRIGNVLDALSFPAGARSLDAGQSTMQASGTIGDTDALSHIQNVVNSEVGLFLIRGDGYVVFEDRHHRLKGTHISSAATFGGAGGKKYQGIEIVYDKSFLYNDISVTREGGTEQTASDATSITAFLKRKLSKTGLLNTSDADALAYAQYLCAKYKNPVPRVKSITIYPDSDPANLWPTVLSLDISDRITIVNSQKGINKDFYIEGISEDYNFVSGVNTVRYELSDADVYNYWVLDDAALSLLDTTTRLTF